MDRNRIACFSFPVFRALSKKKADGKKPSAQVKSFTTKLLILQMTLVTKVSLEFTH